MFKRSLVVLLALSMLSVLLIAGCDFDLEDAESQVVIAIWSAPEGLFNTNLSESSYDVYSYDPVFCGMMRYDPHDNYELVPDLAEEMEVSEDGQTLTFTLRDDIYFHDGEPVTAEDVKWTFEWMVHPDYTGVRASMWIAIEGFEEFNVGVDEEVEGYWAREYEDADGETQVKYHAPELTGVQVLDERTVEFTLSKVDAPSLINIATWDISPKHVFEGTEIADLELHEAITHPIGAGPFEFVRYEEGQFTEMKAYDNYHLGRPKLDRIIVKVASHDVAQAELITGDTDIAWVQPDASDLAMYEDEGLQVFRMPANAYQYMGIQMDHPILGDKDVRHAITYAIDRWAMVDNLFDGLGIVQISHMSSVSWAYDPDAEPLPFDPEKAAELLDDAGWELGDDGFRYKDGEKLALSLAYPTGNVPRENSAEIIQQMLADVGIQLELDIMDFAALIPKVYDEQDFDLYLMGWSLAMEPDPSGIWLSTDHWNAVNFINEESDQLIVEGRATLDQDERIPMYHEWQQILLEEAPYVWLYAEEEVWVAGSHINNFVPDAFDPYWDIWLWSVE